MFEKKATRRSGIEAELRPQSITTKQMSVDQHPDIFDFTQDDATSKLNVWLKPFVLFKSFTAEEFPQFTGMVAPFAMETAPPGWLVCNGATVSQTAYANLFAKIGTIFEDDDSPSPTDEFRLPDLRGEFIRGWDDDRGIDAGRAFGTLQLDALEDHYHSYAVYQRTGNSDTVQTTDTNFTWVTRNTSSPLGARVDEETRPRNLAMLYCIKY